MGGGYTKEQLLARLRELQIDFICYEHPAVLTVEAQAKYVGHLGGGLSKNLFLKDKKHRFYVVSALASTTVDLKVLSQRLGLGKGGLRMAPEEALQEILQVPLGCVTPFALINESAQNIPLLLDQGFKVQKCCFFHPLSNDLTISLSVRDLDKFLISIGRNPSYVDLEAASLVGKDQPPDLAGLVPSAVPILASPLEKAVSVQLPAENHVPIEKKSTNFAGDAVKEVNQSKGISAADPRAAATNVGKFIDEIIEKTTAAVLAEITKESDEQQKRLLGPVLDQVRRRIGSDLENQTMSFKNAVYTEGFHSGVHSVFDRGLQSLSFRR